jgi:hypothetical protein
MKTFYMSTAKAGGRPGGWKGSIIKTGARIALRRSPMNPSPSRSSIERAWPALPLSEWQETYDTLHMWTQIVGKVRMQLTPMQVHWWNVALYVTARGLTTSPIPYGDSAFEVRFNFLEHRLEIETADGASRALKLEPKSVARFYHEFLSELRAAGVEVQINAHPQEVPGAIPFDQDEQHAQYAPEYAQRLHRILLSTHLVFEQFRSRFIGKSSPVHFFWGSFDLAYTRFSGRVAPKRKGVITGEAYSHECSSVGWWPGSGPVNGPAFYAYAAPEPAGYREQRLKPDAAQYRTDLGEFILMYDDVRTSASPGTEILAFAESAYNAAANSGKWDRAALDRQP